MSSRTDWEAKVKPVLNAEVERWSKKSCDELLGELKTVQAYEIKTDAGSFQVEIDLLENTDSYVQVMVAVDDGRLPMAMRPLTGTFICHRGAAVRTLE
jgi:hypothetical protein